MNTLMEVWSLCRDVISLHASAAICFPQKVFSIVQEKVAL
jgi:hypothetical protein